MGADLFRGDVLCLAQRGDGFLNLAALRVGARDGTERPGSALGRQPSGIDAGSGAYGASRVAELDSYRDLMQAHVGRAELGVVVVAPFSQLVGDLPGPLQVPVRGVGVADTRGGDGALQGQSAP